jgi:hypothetical protein
MSREIAFRRCKQWAREAANIDSFAFFDLMVFYGLNRPAAQANE